jgi:hypothetical protein
LIAALVCPADGRTAPDATLTAVERQTRAPDELLAAPDAGALGGLARDAIAHGADWLWLLDCTALPEPHALQSLLAPLEDLGDMPAPALLASKLVGADGSPDPHSLPLPASSDLDLVVAACERRLLALRVAQPGSLLVHRRAIERWGTPPAGEAALWTARLLTEQPGLLVPGSVAVRQPGGDGARAEISGLWKLLAGDALERNEKPWLAFRLLERTLEALRG